MLDLFIVLWHFLVGSGRFDRIRPTRFGSGSATLFEGAINRILSHPNGRVWRVCYICRRPSRRCTNSWTITTTIIPRRRPSVRSKWHNFLTKTTNQSPLHALKIGVFTKFRLEGVLKAVKFYLSCRIFTNWSCFPVFRTKSILAESF